LSKIYQDKLIPIASEKHCPADIHGTSFDFKG